MKRKRYWLWGGLIGVFISLGAYYYLDNIGDSTILNIFYLPAIIVYLMLFGFDSYEIAEYSTFIIYGFILGSIVGWIYGKIINKKARA